MENLEDVVTRMKNGERGAYEALVDHFQPAVFRLAFRLTGNREDSWDVVQEVFLAVHRKREELREPASFKPWLYRMAYCRAVDTVRVRRGGRPILDEEAASPVPGPAGQAEGRALQHEMTRAVSALPEKFREPLLLSTQGDLSYEQIARELGCPIGTVRSRISTARQLLRERLAGWFGWN